MVDTFQPQIKRRRITSKDYEKIELFVLEELKKREGSQARKKHSRIWETLDKQIAMEPPDATPKSGDPDEDWHSTIQLGLMADALEVISADIMRLAFPIDRKWFRPHIELSRDIDPETGERTLDPDLQNTSDGVLRSFMSQQHMDFGFRDRVKLAVKESLSHGGVMCEVRKETMMKVRSGGRVEKLISPVLVPHSMWNVYPDPSPSIMGTDLFYRGSMIWKQYMPRHRFMENPVFIRKNKVPKKENKPEGKDDTIKDVELVYYCGDLTLTRKDGDVYIPNVKVILANETLVYAKPGDLPYAPIIYTGYERDSVLDPYYTSVLIKRSPTSKLVTELSNRFVDAAGMKAEPPVVYDSYDSKLVSEGGPKLAPGEKIGIKGGASNFQAVDIGDPSFLFTAVQALTQEVQQGTSVDTIRSGVSPSTDQTATEVSIAEQKGEVRTVDFLSVLDRQLLKPYLHMQHDMNRDSLENYPFYNNEVHTPDFMRLSKSDLPENVIFDVVGSKEVLGEQQRMQKFVTSVQFASQIEPVSQKTNWEKVTEELWHFSGIKDPEQYLLQNDENSAIVAQFQEIMQQMQAQMAELEQEKQIDELEKEQLQSDVNELQNEIKILEETKQSITQIVSATNRLRDTQHRIELLQAKQKTE